MAYSIDQDQIIQEVTLAAESHPQLAIAQNRENLLITLCNWYDAYDKLDPTTDLANWTVMSRAEYDALDIHPQCAIEDQTHVFLDENQVMIHSLQKVVDELGLDYPGSSQVIINKTPHPVTVVDSEGSLIHTFPKCESADPIRLAVRVKADSSIGAIPTSVTVFGEPTGLPEYQDGIFYIVSQLVKNALADRADLLVPAEVLRNADGTIIGCQSLGR